MKKTNILISGLLFAFLFSSCKFLDALGKNQTETKISSVEVIELTESNTQNGKFSFKEKVSDNSKVYVVQVYMNEDVIDKSDLESGLLSSVNPDLSDSDFSFRTVGYEDIQDDFFIEVPEYVKDFNSKPRPVLSPENSFVSQSYSQRTLENVSPEEGDTKEFVTPITNSKDPDDFNEFSNSTLKYISKYAYVYYYPNILWLEDEGYGENYLSYEDFKTLGDKFDDIYEAETNLLGSKEITFKNPGIVETSDKITILVNDIYCDSTKSNSGSVYGYFAPIDLYMNNYDDIVVSNECEIIYIDSVLYKKSPVTTLSTLAHEFNHLLNSVNKEINSYHNDNGNYVCSKCSTWFTEMLSMVSEDILHENYLKDSFESPSVYKNRLPYYCGNYNLGFTAWPENGDTYTNLCYYGNTFAYGTFLMRNYGGAELIEQIAKNKSVDADSINAALNKLKIKSPFDNTKQATFEDTVKDFSLSCLNYDIEKKSNIHSFVNEVNQTIGGFDYKSEAIYLDSYNPYLNKEKLSSYGLYCFDKNSGADLRHTGSIIQYAGLGKDLKEITVTLPEYDKLYMYVLIQNFK